jgi:predicted metal-dependent HD superfamily phosphohydrolase
MVFSTIGEIALCEQAAYLVDLDLAILGRDGAEYYDYERSIRNEFGLTTDKQWYEGRTKFLESMLKRSHVFVTSNLSIFESRARINMNEELERLESHRKNNMELWYGKQTNS